MGKVPLRDGRDPRVVCNLLEHINTKNISISIAQLTECFLIAGTKRERPGLCSRKHLIKCLNNDKLRHDWSSKFFG